MKTLLTFIFCLLVVSTSYGAPKRIYDLNETNSLANSVFMIEAKDSGTYYSRYVSLTNLQAAIVGPLWTNNGGARFTANINADGNIVGDGASLISGVLQYSGTALNLTGNGTVGGTGGNIVVSNHNVATGTNWITDLADIGTPASGDLLTIIDVSTATRKRVNASEFLSAASQTPWTSDIDADNFSLLNLASLTVNGNAFLGNEESDAIVINGIVRQQYNQTIGQNLTINQGSLQFTNLSSESALNPPIVVNTNTILNLLIIGNGNIITNGFNTGLTYFTAPTGIELFTIDYFGGTTNITTTAAMVKEHAAAANITADAGIAMIHQATNRMAANSVVAVSNLPHYKEFLFNGLGAASGGSDYTLIMTNASGYLFVNRNVFGGTGLTNRIGVTVTNGNDFASALTMIKMNGTNVIEYVSRQSKF